MQLTRLEIKGFKSFGDKITINFNEGVTAIVGPNGCGKSNVVDAIRWVLGEQRTKNLRSEKMENIIFNGTKTRKAANLAEVSLSFDNTKNILPTEFSQVTITRKLYRTGESEYRLNDVQCRLKDITDLFLDTGIGNDSYSIIELKMIDEIINNKENSRRALFEEASGISKYKVRKKQTLNKLKDTEADLSRVEDLLFEIEKNLKTLENQAKKAERYYKLKDQYKELSVSLASFRISNFREALERLDEQHSAQEDERNLIVTQLDTLEAELQKLKQESLVEEKNLSVQQKAANEYTSKIRAYESEKKVKNEQLKNLNDKEQRLSKELANDRQQINHVLYNIKRLNEEQLLEQQKLDEIKISLDEQKQEVDELRGQQQTAKTKLDAFVHENNQLQNNIYKLEKEIAVLHIQKDALSQESERNIVDTEAKESELNEFSKVVDELEGRVDALQEEYDGTLAYEEELQQQIANKEVLIQSYKEAVIKDNRTLDAKQNEYNLTKSLVDNLEGFPESIRFLRKNAGWAKPYPLLSDVLFCKEEYRVAIENFLEPVMNHYVVNERQEAVKAIKLLGSASRGRAGFFVLEAITQPDIRNGLDLLSDERFIPALSVVDTEERYLPLIKLLLHDVYILKTEDESDLETPLPDTQLTILHKTGKFAKFRLGMSGGSVGLFEGKRIGRAKNLDNLSKEIKQLTTHLEKIQLDIVNETALLNDLKANTKKSQLEETKLQLNRLSNELISVKTKQEQYLSFIQNSQNRKQDIEEKIRTIQAELAQAEPALASLTASKIDKANELTAFQENFNEISERLTTISSAYNQENIRYHQQQNKVAGINKDLEYRESQHENLEKRITQYSTEYEAVKEAIKDTLQHVDHSDEDLIAMYAQKEALEKGLQEAEQQYYTMRANINKKEEEIGGFRKRKDQIELLTNELKDKKNSLKLDLNALKERLAVEFEIDINELLDNELPDHIESEEELRNRTEKLKKQLEEFGAINSMAMEAYQEMNERYTFIQKERKDLFDAKTSLLDTIKEIDDTARDKFMESFTQVREHFITVFRSLFNEEDSCDLVLSNPDLPLESDIEIMARPKGKRPLSINQLSGGEKTLTSTALLFSLYLLKPAPFCIFDEVDAPLDDTNIDKFNNIIRKFSNQSQFIIVSHNKRTIASTDIIYGVTMVEQGVSRVVAVDMREV
ncbi:MULTISPECIES: chromosome segregation protein SMC [Olivibacter]|uniref:Chromosome partition protein Smc n=2 Tax=Olivibacter TaxID=376469 RepID=A0ABV6HKG5_9SPHI|nr:MULTISPECIES: chromosome segregation protein SMC [Olivibacter]MCL4639341.1 chromosome segregation protein SMC [Olivibacter sp. UJ_SKK_5.1]MDM8175128.1 chromosome segregation protein SMC [Olivibacter sp. 47]MDX3913191.1 chromosome segregation protein SMC [Pseudosphingobacterium sp.]QEL01902.1 chromosome segregation protein SMC [Olivibacter sp. LS-1]